MSVRFDSSLGLNVHLHMLAIDGVYAADDDGNPQFEALLAPDNEEIERLAALLAERIPNFSSVAALDRTVIQKNAIHPFAMSRGGPPSTRLP